MRAALYPLARERLLFAGWARVYYERKRAQGKTSARAVRALSPHWVRLLYARWRRREPYQRDRLLAAQQAHAILHATPPAQPAAEAAIRSTAAVVTRAAPEAARPTPLGARPVHPAGVGPRHRERREGVPLTGCARRVDGSAATERVGVLAGADGGHGGQG